MTDFIIYEENWELYTKYQMVILNYLGCRQDKFKIYDYCDYEFNSCNNKIYILGADNPHITLNIAKKIRNLGDWESQIIFINREKYVYKDNKLLILNSLISDENLRDNLKSTLSTANKILSSKKSLCFKMRGEICKIPYRDILYIEKDYNQNRCIIYTNDSDYIIKDTIINLEEKLEATCFFKTNRSCIVNLENVISYNCSSHILYFKNAKIDLISREKRQLLKERLLDSKVFN